MEERFAFGKNWTKYSKNIDTERIRGAEESLKDRLGDLSGKTFLDIGSGSGLFSLAARNLGARVVSFDYDPDSVHCTEALKNQYHAGDDSWRIFQGSVLDADMLGELGRFDIVYSWGVLHHTGSMWEAIDNAASRVGAEGLFFIAIYNDQGGYSKRWKRLKRLYLKVSPKLQPMFAAVVLCLREVKPFLGQLLRGRIFQYFKSKEQTRSMTFWTNWLDWIGGYPFEVAKPEDIFYFCRKRGFTLVELSTCRGELGCNEFVFKKEA